MRDLIRKMAQLHQLGEVEELVDLFAEPLIVFPVSGPSRRSWRSDTKISVERLLDACNSAGVKSLVWDELAMETQAGENSSILVRWRYLDVAEQLIAKTEIRYFCGRTEGSALKILMIEYLTAGFPTALYDMPKSFTPQKPN